MSAISFNPTSSQIAMGVAAASAGALALQLADFEIPGIQTITKLFRSNIEKMGLPEMACAITLGASLAAMGGSDHLSSAKTGLSIIGINGVIDLFLSGAAKGSQTAILAGLGIVGLNLIEESLQK
ncbi:MAG: hypothetical protein JSS09_05105 [Verrucomicrobia bacterium]|nr:hypothetical protein [Verrucomicrobiota bacterium]